MIKAKLTTPEGTPVIMVGLSHHNLDWLRGHKPIMFDLAELGIEPSVSVVIFSGATEDDMRAEMAEHFDLGKVIDNRPSRD